MIFKEEYEAYGNKFYVRLLSTKEAFEMSKDETEGSTFVLVADIVLDEKGNKIFKNAEDVKNSLPIKVIEDIISISMGNDIKKK